MHFVIIPTQYDEHGDLGRLMPAETTEQIEAIEQVMREDGLQELSVYSGSSDDLDDEQDVVETQMRIVVRQTRFELQGYHRGIWDSSNVTWNTDATLFDTYEEAREELEYWVGEGRNPDELRIVEVEN